MERISFHDLGTKRMTRWILSWMPEVRVFGAKAIAGKDFGKAVAVYPA